MVQIHGRRLESRISCSRSASSGASKGFGTLVGGVVEEGERWSAGREFDCWSRLQLCISRGQLHPVNPRFSFLVLGFVKARSIRISFLLVRVELVEEGLDCSKGGRSGPEKGRRGVVEVIGLGGFEL